MKKILYTSIFAFILLFVSATSISAAGTFECRWRAASASCRVNGSSSTCSGGSTVDTSKCIGKSKTDCESGAKYACIGGSTPTPTTAAGGGGGDFFNSADITEIENAITSQTNIRRFDNIGELLAGTGGGINLITLFTFFAGFAFVIYLVIGGISMMMSKGDPRAVATAQQTITNALIGLVIVLIAYWVVQITALVLGLDTILSVF